MGKGGGKGCGYLSHDEGIVDGQTVDFVHTQSLDLIC